MSLSLPLPVFHCLRQLLASKSVEVVEVEEDWIYYDDSVHLSDFWQELVDSKSDENPVSLWLRLFEQPDPSIEKFKEFWRITVPRLLSPAPGKSSLDQTWNEERVQRVLLDTLEAFVAGGVSRVNEMYQVRASDLNVPVLRLALT